MAFIVVERMPQQSRHHGLPIRQPACLCVRCCKSLLSGPGSARITLHTDLWIHGVFWLAATSVRRVQVSGFSASSCAAVVQNTSLALSLAQRAVKVALMKHWFCGFVVGLVRMSAAFSLFGPWAASCPRNAFSWPFSCSLRFRATRLLSSWLPSSTALLSPLIPPNTFDFCDLPTPKNPSNSRARTPMDAVCSSCVVCAARNSGFRVN